MILAPPHRETEGTAGAKEDSKAARQPKRLIKKGKLPFYLFFQKPRLFMEEDIRGLRIKHPASASSGPRISGIL